MSGTRKKRRRWPWILLAAVVLFAGPPLAWRYRPLNATERGLVGTWITPQTDEIYVFTPDRRFRYSLGVRPRSTILEGSWQGGGGHLQLRSDLDHLFESRTTGGANLFRRVCRFVLGPRFGVAIRFEGSTVDFGQGVYLRADPQTFRPPPPHDPRP